MSSEGLEQSAPLKVSRGSTYATLDAWRGVACLAVVLFHSTAPLGGQYPWLRALPLYRIASHGAAGIHLFFVISGYCIAAAAAANFQRGAGSWSYVRARVRRIYPPYLAALICVLALYAGFSMARRDGGGSSSFIDYVRPALTPRSLMANSLLAQVPAGVRSVLAVAWTLSYEVGFYAVVGVFLALAYLRRNPRWMLDGLHVLTCASLLILWLAPRRMFYPLDFWPGFGLGVIVYDLYAAPSRGGRARPLTYALMLTAAGLMLAAIVSMTSDVACGYAGDITRKSCILTLAFAGLITVLRPIDLLIARLKPMAALAFIGRYSYSLYLIHVLVIAVVAWLFKRRGLDQRLHYLCAAACVTASLLAAYVFFRLFELPFMSSRNRSRAPIPNPNVAQSPPPPAKPIIAASADFAGVAP